MEMNLDNMREHAHKLALEHDASGNRVSSKVLWRRMEEDIRQLRGYIAAINESSTVCEQPADEWLRDHAEFLEAELAGIREALADFPAKELPALKGTDLTRAASICSHYLALTDGLLDDGMLEAYLDAYQDVAVLTTAEAWSLSLFLQMELLRKLAMVVEPLRERRLVCLQVDRMLAGIPASELNPETFKAALDREQIELPLSGAMTVHLVKHLRDHAEDSAHMGEWLVCKLENPPEDLDAILSYEYRLQAEYQVSAGNVIGSLRKLSRWDWSVLFERISIIERTLRGEQANDYPRLDSGSRHTLRHRVERLARRMHVPENLVASQAVSLADDRYGAFRAEETDTNASLPPRESYAAYYLLEARGMRRLQSALKQCGKAGALPEAGFKRRASGIYLQLVALGTLAALLAMLTSIIAGIDEPIAAGGLALAFALLLIPASEWSVTLVHWLIERVTVPDRLLRYDFSKGIPQDANTMIVIPVIWSRLDDIAATLERLELHYLANRDPQLRFAILSDFRDTREERLASDEPMIRAALSGVERLNRDYPGTPFHLFHRGRRWNASENVWMGWERKRGKLEEFVKLLRGDTRTSFERRAGDDSALGHIRYVITLDADTRLPLESAQRMVGAIHLPYNRPRLSPDGMQVIEGYGVLQPRIGMTYESARKSRLTALFAHEAGLDPYAFAVSDPYQDATGQGIFTGKGIFDVQTFHHILSGRLPENRVLSHDLLEGGFLRTGLLSDIELIDDHPPTFLSQQKRLHRWTRGDWQLLPWLRSKASSASGERIPTRLSLLTRWQIADNMRRSLLSPALLAMFLLATVLPGPTLAWYTVVCLTLLLPVIRQLFTPSVWLQRPGALLRTAAHACLTLLILPFQSAMLLGAIMRTLFRLLFSKRKLLEWTSQSEVERQSDKAGAPPMTGMGGGFLFAAILAASMLLTANESTTLRSIGFAVAILWCVTPLVIRWLDGAPARTDKDFTASQREDLHTLARDIWDFYEDFVTEKDHWLPPDNVQIEPDRGIAHRTSPTNIGMYALCAVAARDFGFIDTRGLVERLEQTISTIEQMEKWEGHLYNWYDTETLRPLLPIYVSTVDSGNLAASLMAVREGLLEWLQADWGGKAGGGNDNRGNEEHWGSGRSEVAFANELGSISNSELMRRGNALASRIDVLTRETNFKPLHDSKTNLFSLGYHVGRRERDEVLYDLLASEARQASFVAIAMGQIPVSHWNALGRTMTKIRGNAALLSWSGTMFEYMMPWLLMRTYRDTVWDSTYKAVVGRQIDYAKQKGVPFGISESGYFAFDHQLNYQYRAFGVPGLGFKRGLEQDLVLAPYATIMALPYAREESIHALAEFERIGGRGRYGYYEALDFTPRRLRQDGKHAVIQSFMAHHQGMSLLTLSNLLLPHSMIDRFHRNKEVQAAELLLQERIPEKAKLIRHPALHRLEDDREKTASPADPIREFSSPHTKVPETCVLSNGRFSTIVTASGSGYSSFDGMSVSRWREDPVRDSWGSFVYIRDVATSEVWSASYQPCRGESPDQRIRFELGKATFERSHNELNAKMEICASPEFDAEIRRITLTNNGSQNKMVEVTTYVELALANPIADDAHTAFSKLFIRTAYDEGSGCLVASRRKREAKEQALWAAHSLISDGASHGSPEFETDRSAFIGRGFEPRLPQSISSRLKGKTGSVADPAFVMRRHVQIEPGSEAVLYAVTSVGESRSVVIEAASAFGKRETVEREFQLAWTRSRIELRSLGLDLADAYDFQRLAAQVLYTPPLSASRSARIEANVKGQPGLWAYGVSGDKPAVVAEIDNRSRLPFIMKLLSCHEYLRRLGIRFDLVILNYSEEGYSQELQDSLSRAVEHGVDRFGAGHANIRVLPAAQIPQEDLTLLLAFARLTLRASGPSIAVQLRLPRRAGETPDSVHAMKRAIERGPLRKARAGEAEVDTIADAIAETLEPSSFNTQDASSSRFSSSGGVSLDAKEVKFYNGWGGFANNGKQYKLQIDGEHHLPAPWINVLANPGFGALVSELGTGYTFWRNSRECKLTPWSNDPVLDEPGELGFLRDEESGIQWTLTPSAGSNPSPYVVTHGLGNSMFEHEREGIRHSFDLYVPMEDPVKIMRLQLRNESPEPRKLSVTYYAEWVIGVQRQSNASFISCEWDEEAQILTAQNRYQDIFREATPFLGVFPQQPREEESVTWTADQLSFVGRNGSVYQPAALNQNQLDKRAGVHYASCGAVQRKLTLSPGEEREVIILLGCATSRDNAAELASKYANASQCDEAWQATSRYWEDTLEQIVVETPSEESNMLLNGWLLYQSVACRMWARTAFYQAGGAFGFRDQLQDSLAILHTRPQLTRKQILLSASHQYEEGDVQHWWHEETSRGIRTLFSDDLLWLPYTVSRYVEHTEDRSILDELVPYITSEILKEGEHERYEETVRSSRSGTIYEHCTKAIDKSLSRIGEHGLPHIGVGDWNDGMNLVGDEGRGESVWLGWFLCEVLSRLEPLCEFCGDTERAVHYKQEREKLAASIHEHAWDGQWYRRAFTDAGTWLGSLYNDECRIDAIAQSWSVISGAAPADRALQAMQSFDRELVDREMDVIRLLTPPFDVTEPSPGYIQGYPPGIRENGAQYTHGVLWGIVAWTKLGRGDKAFELFRMLNPINHTRTDREVRTYYGEPYVMAADVYTAEPHRGHAGWTWYTGASSWMYQSGIEWILGLRKRGNRLYLDPCVPPDWPGFKVSYRFGETRYQLEFHRDSTNATDTILAGPDTYIDLQEVGGEQLIRVRLT
ncbi:GH36-type glycosyl hydrolase domain-containing protein [Paenibacillus sp. strain BS8-2]